MEFPIQFHTDWRRLLLYAWSIRWMAAAFVFALGDAVTTVFDPPQSLWLRLAFALLSAVSGVGGVVSRLMVQEEFPTKAANG